MNNSTGNNHAFYSKPRRLLLVMAIGLAISTSALAAEEAGSCPNAPAESINDFLPPTEESTPNSKAVTITRFEQAGTAEKLNEAGLFAEARQLLTTLYGNKKANFSPQAALTIARSYRLQATDLNSAAFGTEPSKIAARRVDCLEQADLFLDDYLASLENILSPSNSSDTDTTPAISPESATVLYGLFALERAETQLQFGDFLFSQEPQQFLASTAKPSTERESAMVKYRAARIYLAMAEGARPALANQDHAVSRRALLAEKLKNRLRWFSEGLFFGGLAYLRDTPSIGLESEGAEFALSGQLKKQLLDFKTREKALTDLMKEARTKIREGAKALRELDKESSKFNTMLRTELFQELTSLEGRTGSHDIKIKEEIKLKMGDLENLTVKHTASLEELKKQRNDAKKIAKAAYDKVFADLTVLKDLASLSVKSKSPLKALWDELAAKANKERGEGKPLLLPKIDQLAEFKERLNAAEIDLKSSDEEKLANVQIGIDGKGNATTEWGELTTELVNIASKRGRLEVRLKRQKVERVIVLANTQKISLDDEISFVKNLVKERSEELRGILISEKEIEVSKLKEQLYESGKELQKEARDYVLREVKEVDGLITNAEEVFKAIEQGAKNFEAATQAAQAVFTTMQAIPAGTGMVMIQDRDSMVALKNSATDLIKFTITNYQDALQVKSQIAKLKNSLREYEKHLRELSFEKLKDDITHSIEGKLIETSDALVARHHERIDRIDDSLKQARDLTALNQRINEHKQTIKGADITQTEKLIKQTELDVQQVEDKKAALTLKIREAIITIWQDSEALDEELVNVGKLNDKITDIGDKFEEKKEQVDKKYQELIEAIDKNKELQQSRTAQILLNLDALNSGKPNSTTPGVNWNLSRELILGTLGDRLGFEAGLATAFQRFDDARQIVNRSLFDYANAMLVLTQNTEALKWGAVYVHTHSDAEKSFEMMNQQYIKELKNNFGVKTDRFALKITKDSIESLLKDSAAAGQVGKLPYCLIQRDDANPDEPDRCLRIRLMASADLLPLGVLDKEKLEALEPQTIKLTQLLFGEDSDAQVTAIEDLAPVSVFKVLNTVLPSTDNQSELVFAPGTLTGDTNRPHLLDVFLTHPSNDDQGLSGLKAVGTSWGVCGKRVVNIIAANNQGFDKTSNNPVASMGAFKAATQLNDLRRATTETSGEFSIRMVSKVSTRSATGRGLGNTFEVRVDDPQALPETMYLVVVYQTINCDRDQGTIATRVEPFESNVDHLKNDLQEEKQFLARSLLDFELSLSHIKTLATADDSNDAARLDTLEHLNDLLGESLAFNPALKTDANRPITTSTTNNPADQQAWKMLEDQWQTTYTKAIEAYVVSPAQSDLTDRLEKLVNAETSGGGITFDSEVIKTNPGKYGSFRRPPSLDAFEYVSRLILGKSDPSTLKGALPQHLKGTLKDTDTLFTALGPVVKFHKRSMAMMTGMRQLLDEGEERMNWMSALTAQLNEQFHDGDRYVALPAMLCVAYTMEQQGFWLTQIDDESLKDLKDLRAFEESLKDKEIINGGLNLTKLPLDSSSRPIVETLEACKDILQVANRS